MTLLDTFQVYPGLLAGCAGLLGLVLGSFLNVVIHRLPLMLQAQWQRDSRAFLDQPVEEPAVRLNLVTPNSRCPHCHAPIRAWQNIPLISYALLRGRCHHCRAPIGLRYPIVELLTGCLLATVAWRWGFSGQALAASVFTCVLIAAALIDLDTQLLPDVLTLPLLWLGLALNTQALFVPLEAAVWGAIAGYGVLWLVYQLFRLLTGKEGMGFGDFKLLGALGAWCGVAALPAIILVSTLSGIVLGGLYLLWQRGESVPIPFGPYLAVAGWIVLLWGPALNHWYLSTFF